jgi:hypothetical protein
LRKALFKPSAFFKGIILPLCEVKFDFITIRDEFYSVFTAKNFYRLTHVEIVGFDIFLYPDPDSLSIKFLYTRIRPGTGPTRPGLGPTRPGPGPTPPGPGPTPPGPGPTRPDPEATQRSLVSLELFS